MKCLGSNKLDKIMGKMLIGTVKHKGEDSFFKSLNSLLLGGVKLSWEGISPRLASSVLCQALLTADSDKLLC